MLLYYGCLPTAAKMSCYFLKIQLKGPKAQGWTLPIPQNMTSSYARLLCATPESDEYREKPQIYFMILLSFSCTDTCTVRLFALVIIIPPL